MSDDKITLKDHLQKIAASGARATNAQLRGTDTAKERAQKAAKARWDKYHKANPKKRK